MDSQYKVSRAYWYPLWLFHFAMKGQTSAVHKEIFDWSLLAIQTPFSDWSLYVISCPFPSTKLAEHLTSAPHHLLSCARKLCHMESNRMVHVPHHWWQLENVTSYIILLQNFTPNSNSFCSSQPKSILMAENQLEYLSLDVRGRCWKSFSHPDCVTSRAQPDSSDPRKEKIFAVDFLCVPYRNIFLLSTGSIKNCIIISKSHRISEWCGRDLQSSSSSTHCHEQGHFTISGCSKPDPTKPWTLSEMEHPSLSWAVCTSILPPSP